MSKSRFTLIGMLAIGLFLKISLNGPAFGVNDFLAVAEQSTGEGFLNAPPNHHLDRDESVLALPEGESVSPRASSPISVTVLAPYSTTSWDDRALSLGKFSLPMVYLNRQREPTPEFERTLDIEIAGLPAGTEIEMEVQSRHVNVSTDAWHRASKHFVLPDRACTSLSPCQVQWTFEAASMYSDFYDLRVKDAAGNLLWENGSPDRPDFVALDTWDVVLDSGQDPAYTVRITYATLFPFATGKHDLKNRLRPDEVTDFVAFEFASIVRDAWHTQFEAWGFGKPIHPQWDPDGLVEVIVTDPPFALFDGIGTHTTMVYKDGLAYPERRIWWVSTANSSFRAYDSLGNAYKVAFAHEFFHLMQWNVLLSAGCSTDMWLNVFIEGQGALAPSVQYPELELSGAHGSWSSTMYLRSVMRFLMPGAHSSFKHLEADPKNKYAAALYWRFLYEQYGGMAIIRAALEEMACGYDPDIVAGMPEVMDRAFERVDGPFHTFEQSIVAFALANYALRLENGRCSEDDLLNCHGFYYDPAGAYATPLVQDELRYAGEPLAVDGAVENSFATDFIEVRLDPELHGQPLTVRLQQEGSVARFNVQVWTLGQGQQKPRALALAPETVPADQGGTHTYTIPSVDTTAYERLALIITRLDADEAIDPVGAYRLMVDAGS